MSIMGIGIIYRLWKSGGGRSRSIRYRQQQYVYLKLPSIFAEKLVELHPGRYGTFARSGGEANSIGIRIARTASGKDNVAFVVIMVGMTGTFRPT